MCIVRNQTDRYQIIIAFATIIDTGQPVQAIIIR